MRNESASKHHAVARASESASADVAPTLSQADLSSLVARLQQELAEERMVREAAEQAEMHYHKELVAAEQARDALKAGVTAFLAKWELVEPRINGMFGLQFVRSGVQYDGPTLAPELATLRALLDPQKETTA